MSTERNSWIINFDIAEHDGQTWFCLQRTLLNGVTRKSKVASPAADDVPDRPAANAELPMSPESTAQRGHTSCESSSFRQLWTRGQEEQVLASDLRVSTVNLSSEMTTSIMKDRDGVAERDHSRGQ